MTLSDRIRAIVAAMPVEGLVALPVATLGAWLREEGTILDQDQAAFDLTVEGVAEVMKLKVSRTRQIIRENQAVLGAYRRGRRWYVPVEGLRAYQRSMSGFLSDTDVATATGRTLDTVRRWCEEGSVQATRQPGGGWKITAASLPDVLAGRRRKEDSGHVDFGKLRRELKAMRDHARSQKRHKK